MKGFISLAAIFVLLFSNLFCAQNNSDKKYKTENIVGLSFEISGLNNLPKSDKNYNKALRFIEVKDQICFESDNFPVFPYIEPDISVGLKKFNPKYFDAVLFGFKKDIMKRHGLTFSLDFGSGLAMSNNYAGVVGRFSVDIRYKNFVVRLVDFNLFSGFPFKVTTAPGISYAIQ